MTARRPLNSEAMREVPQRIGQLLEPESPDRVREGYHRGYQAAVNG